MIDVKDIAKKAAAGCPHSAPIVIPCAGCMESALALYEPRVREDVKKEIRDEWEAMQKEVKRLADEISVMTTRAANLKANAAKVDGINRELVDKLKAVTRERDDLKVCLATEQAYKVNKMKGVA